MPEAEVAPRMGRDWLGSLVGLLVFLGGVALLLLVFKSAYDIFSIPPENALGLQKGKTMDIPTVGNSVTSLGVRILMLILMGFMGSLIASRGIALYAAARGR